MDGNNMNEQNNYDYTTADTQSASTYSYGGDAYVADVEEATAGGNGLALASMIIGIVSLVLTVTVCCCGGWVGIPMAIISIVGLILGIMAKKKDQKKGFVMAGIICNSIAIVLGIILVIAAIVGVAFLSSDAYSDIMNL